MLIDSSPIAMMSIIVEYHCIVRFTASCDLAQICFEPSRIHLVHLFGQISFTKKNERNYQNLNEEKQLFFSNCCAAPNQTTEERRTSASSEVLIAN